MINKILETIKEYNLINEGDKVVLGVSGGADSMSMLYILDSLKEKLNFDIVVVTVDHTTRDGESTKDCEFVKEECEKKHIKVYTYTCNIKALAEENNMSTEEAGRKFRYEAFSKVMELEGANKIATAHNLDDNTETVILNLVRGTGLSGLCGIPLVKGKLIRPLLKCSKEEILNFAKDNNIPYKEDSTNKENDFTRNKIRNKIIPYIKEEINPNVLENINSMIEIFNNEKDFIEDEERKAYNECVSSYIESNDETNESNEVVKIDIDKLNNYHLALKKRVIKKAITYINDGSFKDLTSKHIMSVIDILKKGTGKKVSILNSITARVSYDNILIYKGMEDNNELEVINKSHDIIISNNNDTSLMVYEYNNNEIMPMNVSLNEDTYSFKYKDKKITMNVLSEDDRNKFIDKLINDKESFEKELKELSKTKMYFDLDSLIKKTNIISDDNSNLSSIETKIIYKFKARDDGDKILIDNDNHYKKLKDLFIDEKIDREERNKYIVFEKIEKERDNILNEDIIAVLGMRISNKYMVTKDTISILEVTFDM